MASYPLSVVRTMILIAEHMEMIMSPALCERANAEGRLCRSPNESMLKAVILWLRLRI